MNNPAISGGGPMGLDDQFKLMCKSSLSHKAQIQPIPQSKVDSDTTAMKSASPPA